MKKVLKKKVVKKDAVKKPAAVKTKWKKVKTGKRNDAFGKHAADFAQRVGAEGEPLVEVNRAKSNGPLTLKSPFHVFYNGGRISKQGSRDIDRAMAAADKLIPPGYHRIVVTVHSSLTAADVEGGLVTPKKK